MAIRDIVAKKVEACAADIRNDAPSRSESCNISIEMMNCRRFVNPNFQMSSSGGIVGKAKLLVKRAVRKAVRPYVEPIVASQNLFNDATYETVQDLEESTCELRDNNHAALKDMNEAFSREILELKEELRTLESHLGDFATQKNELDRFLENVRMNEKQFADFDKRTTSQSGEDSIVMYILHVLGYDLSKVHYLDLGANHAIALSNTYMLYQRGARGVLVEANPELIPELKMYRSEDVVLNRCVAANSSGSMDFYILSGDGLSTPDYSAVQLTLDTNPSVRMKKKVTVESIGINELFEAYFDGSPEVVNIDVEGSEGEILRTIDFKTFRPLIIIIETIPYRTRLVYGEKRKDFVELMEDAGYVEYAFTGINSIFVDLEVLEAVE